MNGQSLSFPVAIMGYPRSIAVEAAKYWFGIFHSSFMPDAAAASASVNPAVFLKPIQHKLQSLPASSFPEILLNFGCAP